MKTPTLTELNAIDEILRRAEAREQRAAERRATRAWMKTPTGAAVGTLLGLLAGGAAAIWLYALTH